MRGDYLTNCYIDNKVDYSDANRGGQILIATTSNHWPSLYVSGVTDMHDSFSSVSTPPDKGYLQYHTL